MDHKISPALSGEPKRVADKIIASFQMNLDAAKIWNSRKKLVFGSHVESLINSGL
jgi:hypothetical protein